MIRLLSAFIALIFLTTGCGVLIGDLPCCGPATATPTPTQPSREQPKPPLQGTLSPRPILPPKPSIAPPMARPPETRVASPAKPSIVLPPMETRAALPTPAPKMGGFD